MTLLVLAGCGAGASKEAASPGRPTLTIATGFAIDNLDPLKNGFWGPEFGYVELLMRPRPGATPSPWVLAGLANPTPTTWMLTLRDSVRFSDGRPLDGGALAALLNYQLAKNPDFAAALPGAGAVATNDRTVTLTTRTVAPNVPYLLADEAMVPVYDVATYQRYLASGADPRTLVGAGLFTAPYVVRSLDSESMRLSPNPRYWGGTPALRELTVRFVPQASARIQAVQHGEADIALYPSTATAPTLKGRGDSFFVTGRPTGPTFMLEVNHRRAPFDDPLVRRAIYAGIDYKQLANQVMNRLYAPATGLYTADRPWAVKTQAFDRAGAGALLDQAGWRRSGNGPRSRGGTQLSFTMLTYPQQPDSDTLALAVQSQLAALGVTVAIQQVPDMNSAVQDSTGWQAAVVGNGFISFGGDYITPLRNYLRTGGPRNVSGVADPELDTLINRVAAERDPAARDELLRQIQRRVAEQGHVGYLGTRLPAVVTGPAWKRYRVPISNLWVDATTAPRG
jgi:peptide/nickel transport system substrate-binding protein